MTECARCGDCCEEVAPNISVPDLRRRLANPYYAGRSRNQAEKIVNMLTEKIGVRRAPVQLRSVYRCRHFDTSTRLCTAHDERPDMCSGYPWYGRRPDKTLPADFSPRCSFTADVRPLLPIVAVT